jgi:hypothetical protein
MLDAYSLHNFLIWKGTAVTNTPEFASFQRKYSTIWGSILSVLSELEQLMQLYHIPLAVIDGAKLSELAACDAPVTSEVDLLGCISNRAQVMPVIQSLAKSSILFGEKGTKEHTNKNVIKLQTWLRKEMGVRKFRLFRLRSRAALLIETQQRRVAAKNRAHALLSARREREVVQWDGLKLQLKRDWPRFDEHASPHYVLHVPSLSIDEYLRLGLSNFEIQQNLQLTRLADCVKENVEIIYVAPFPLDDEILDYFKKILEIGGVENPHSRFTIIVPENIDRFPSHFALSTMLMYSPHAISRIKQAVRGKHGYMVGGITGWQEKKLSLELNVPLLASESDVSCLYATRSGSKRLFMESDVSVGVGAHDIYDEEDFIVALTKLIASNLDVERWMFKIDVDYGNVGSGYFDVDRLKVMGDLRKERAQLYNIHKGDISVWLNPDVQLLARAKILKELRIVLYSRGVCCGREMFYGLKEFLRVFMRMGGVIEAEPINVIGRPSMNVLVTPLGEVRMLGAVDLLVDDESVLIGSSYPMMSVPIKALTGAVDAVVDNLKKSGFVGYASVNFIAYRATISATGSATATNQSSAGGGGKKAKRELRMCGVSIDPCLSNASCMHNFVKFVCGEAANEGSLTRSYASCDTIANPGLATVQYGSFFKLCRMQAVSFDLETLTGLMFMLYDSLSAGVVGMIAVGENPSLSLERLAGGFGFLKNNVGNTASYNEVNLDDPGEAGMGEMAGFVRIMKAVEAESRRVGLVQKAETRKKLMKEARGEAPP